MADLVDKILNESQQNDEGAILEQLANLQEKASQRTLYQQHFKHETLNAES